MNTSTYYDLKLVEGTDTVNPLIVDVPNYEAIDEAMHDNAVASIGTATELTSGTVHAITRETPDAAMFRFVATADFSAGDTFTIDGIQVTALLIDGTPLKDRAYVINSNVLCCLVGTVLTVYGASGTIETANNSLKLGGELPAYYGKASDVESAITTANAAGVLVNNLNDSLTGIISGTLNPGATSVTLTDSKIHTNSIIEPFYYVNGSISSEPVSYSSITVNEGSLVMTFAERVTALTVGVRVL